MEIAYFLPLILLLETTHPHGGVYALVNFESAAALASITRQNNGDTFQATGIDCNPDACVGLSSGTAAIAEESPKGSCTCQCHRHLPAFREDLQICVDDIHECVLAPFVSGSMSQQIPFVFLPLKGQIIHPSKEISFTGVLTPICAVSGAKFLTGNGWVDLRNPVDTDVPFRLYRDEGRTFLQWEGEADLRNRMGGRLVLVHLMCRELGTNQELPQDLQPVFSPCVAFRVVGSPTKYSSNISEVVFTPDSQSSIDDSQANGLSVSEIVAIGICSILLGLIYVASIFLYLHLRKKRRDAEKSSGMRRDEPSLADAEEGIIKSNPLLGLERHFGPVIDNSCTDSTGSDTDVTPDILQHHDDRKKSIQITSALIHSFHHDHHHVPYLTSIETCPQDSASIECLPEENVSIIETLEGREDRPENVRAIGTTRKKLYFNPAYFEPHLLLTPPPAAVEFLTKIREVITIAKQKMATKRFTPNLLGIPEEESSFSVEQTYEHSQQSARRDSMISLKRENSRRRMCVGGCPGCECEPPQDFAKLPEFSATLAACESCSSTAAENKQRSIRKWLEDIPVIKPANAEDPINNKRIRSPTRVTYFPAPHSRALSPKPSSERAASSTIYSDPTPSIISHPPSKPRYRNRRPPKKPVVKPKTPPPPLPTAKHNYETIKSTSLPPPDMIHEAMAVDRNEEVRIPTITKKKMNAVINEFATQHGIDAPPPPPPASSRPSPELSERRKMRQQVDYETDSLERNTAKTSETSSQPSPSLSTALPMDEELTMRNEIINTNTGTMTVSKLNLGLLQRPDEEEDDYELIVLKKAEGNHPIYHLPELLQRGGSEYSLVSEVYVNNGYNYGSAPSSDNSNSSTLEKRPPTPKVRYEKNQPGHLLIEVADCADNYIRVEDSDSFEPDTLDRKPNRLSLRRSENEADFVDSLERPNQILLRTTGTFKNDPPPPSGNPKAPQSNFNRNLGSLREIYEAKIRKSIQGKFNNNANEAMPWGLTDVSYEGRILTLEERHSKRQRRIPPDVIPPQPIDDNKSSPMPIYEQPKPPRKVVKVDVAKPPLPPKNSLNHKKKAQLFDSESDGNVEKSDASILKSFIHSNDVLFKNGINNQFIFQAATVTAAVPPPPPQNLLFKKHQKKDINWTFKPSPLQKYLERPDDPGYLSTDSNESVPRKKKQQQQQARGEAEGGSETDESLCDGHSESGAESIETHSVFFDSFRKPAAFLSGSLDSGVDSDLMKTGGGFPSNAVLDDGASSDSENMSFKTVVTTRKY